MPALRLVIHLGDVKLKPAHFPEKTIITRGLIDVLLGKFQTVFTTIREGMADIHKKLGKGGSSQM